MPRLLFLAPIFLVLFVPVYYLFLKSSPPLPDFDYDEWWGPASKKDKVDTSIRPFQISFDDSVVKDLKDRLKRTRQLTPPLEGIAFEYGFNSKEIDGWLKYWAEQYNFNERQKFLNKFPQFKTNIQGLDIHFIRVRPEVSAGKEVIPLLLMHGWPGSVREFYEAIPLLTAVSKDRDFAVEVIVPSLPGYGFSDAAVRPGLEAAQIAVVFRNLMHRLGFKKFYIQGGDLGAVVGSSMATIFPEEILGFHSNIVFSFSTTASVLTLIGSLYPPLIVESNLADRMYPISEKYAFILEETGYMHIQASKPDTVGVALSDSPAGLLAYILEKFSTWTRSEYKYKPDGGLAFRFTKDKLIDNLMFYWAPRSITTAIRLYSETFNSKFMQMQLNDLFYSILNTLYKIFLGVALSDSPAGLLAYILEKFSTWTRPEHKYKSDGGLAFRFTKDKLIDNLMFYWVPNSITTSMRPYSEILNSKYLQMQLDDIPTPVPTWFIQSKYELFFLPSTIIKLKYTNLVNATTLEDGGHFLALELPEIFAEDVLKALTAFRKLTPNKNTEL